MPWGWPAGVHAAGVVPTQFAASFGPSLSAEASQAATEATWCPAAAAKPSEVKTAPGRQVARPHNVYQATTGRQYMSPATCWSNVSGSDCQPGQEVRDIHPLCLQQLSAPSESQMRVHPHAAPRQHTWAEPTAGGLTPSGQGQARRVRPLSSHAAWLVGPAGTPHALAEVPCLVDLPGVEAMPLQQQPDDVQQV